MIITRKNNRRYAVNRESKSSSPKAERSLYLYIRVFNSGFSKILEYINKVVLTKQSVILY